MNTAKKNNNINILLLLLGIALVVAGLFLLLSEKEPQRATTVTSFEECVAAGYTVEESYPARCSVPGGESFLQNIGNEREKTDLIRIDSPRPGATVTANESFVVTGEARGYWYFEADFPVEVLNDQGAKIGSGIAVAQGEWMTEDFVPFIAEVALEGNYSGTAELVLHRSNPSDLRENDDELIVPIVLKRAEESTESRKLEANKPLVENPPITNGSAPTVVAECFVGGCSGQICSSDPGVVTTCEWTEKYACYKESVCELQANNECGWTETTQFLACLEAIEENRIRL